MEKVSHIQKLTFTSWKNISDGHKKITHWWGKTYFYYDSENDKLYCKTFTPLGRFFHRAFGYKKKFNRENFWNYLKNRNIMQGVCPKKGEFRKIVETRLKKTSDQKKALAQGLIWATEKTSDDDIIKIFEEGLDINTRINGHTALFQALSNGRHKVVKYLLEKGANVNTVDSEKSGLVAKTPLHVAVNHHLDEHVVSLLEKGADPNVPDAYGETALHLAIESIGRKEKQVRFPGEPRGPRDPNRAIQAILDQAKIPPKLYVFDRDGRTPLYLACSEGDLALVRQLIEKGADPNLSRQAKPPLYAAILTGEKDVVQFLLENGAEKQWDYSSEERERHQERYKMMRIIPPPLPPSGSPLCLACGSTKTVDKEWNPDKEMLQLLLDKKVDVNGTGGHWARTPLHVAVGRNDLETVKFLVGKGARVDSTDKDGITPLGYAQKKEFTDIASYLGSPPSRT